MDEAARPVAPDGSGPDVNERGDLIAYLNVRYVLLATLTDSSARQIAEFQPSPTTTIRPAWSPDGSRLVFVSFTEEEQGLYFKSDIYAIDSDGSHQTRLTDDAGGAWPAWSPDGSKLAYVSYRELKLDICVGRCPLFAPFLFVMNADGSSAFQLSSESVEDSAPAWSPDGSRMAFAAGVSLLAVNVDGSNQVTLASMPSGGPGKVTWSPDGQRLAYEHQGSIKLVDANGGGQVELALGHSPAWSPEGNRLAFVHRGGIQVVNVGTSTVVTAFEPSSDVFADGDLSWSPDGSQLAFSANRSRIGQYFTPLVYVTQADGTGSREVGRGSSPTWAPARR